METVHQTPDNPAERETATPYFLLRRARFDRAVEAVAARRGLPRDPLAA